MNRPAAASPAERRLRVPDARLPVWYLVFAHLHLKGCAALFPVRKQLVNCPGVHHRAREYMGADLRAFFDNADSNLFFIFLCELHDAAGGCQARGARADNHNIKFHSFTFHGAFLLLYWLAPGLGPVLGGGASI